MLSNTIIQYLERNENSFFSIWCSYISLNSTRILYNRKLSDDWLFNHATSILPSSAEITVFEEIRGVFDRMKIQPCIYVLPGPKTSILEEVINASNMVHIDTIEVMHTNRIPPASGNSIHITCIENKDADMWADLYLKAFDVSISAIEEVRRAVSRMLRERVDLLLAKIDGKAVGTLALFSQERVGGIYCVGTDPDYRKHGVGSALLSEAVRLSIRRGNFILGLQILRSANLRNFYVHNGFTKIYDKEVYSSRI